MNRTLLFAGLVTALSACAGRTEPAGDTEAIDITVEKDTLSNGLELILAEDHRLPLVAVNVWYHVGPANEEPGRTGFAHLFEHLMFEGSRHVAQGELDELLEAAGAQYNGSTYFDRTNYYETLPANRLELALWLESDRMGYLLDDLDPARLANQQDVVRNERRQSVEDRPYGIIDEAVYHTLFPQGHPYYADVMGSHADIQAARLGDVKEFFKRYYAPNNATIVLAGDFDSDEARSLVEKYFGTLRRGEPVPRPDVTTPPITSERRVVVQDRIQLPTVIMAWLTPPAFQPGDAEASITAGILGDGRASRLYRRLVYDQQIAQSVTVDQESLELQSVFRIEAIARPGHTPEELEQAIEAELDDMRATAPAETDVARAFNSIETRMVRGIEDIGRFADRLNYYNHYLGDPGYFNADLARYAAVTPAAVQAFVRGYLDPDHRVMIEGVPGEQHLAPPVPSSGVVAEGGQPESVNPEEAWRDEPPAPGAPHPLVVPVPRSFTLANGLTVLVSERPELPIVTASLVVKGGTGANPADLPGLVRFHADMLDKGTTTRDALQLADDVAQLGASLTTSASQDGTRVQGSSIRRVFPDLLGIMADVALHPSFPDAEIERQRSSLLASLAQERDNPSVVARKAMLNGLYGSEHPYGYLETDASAQAITRERLQSFWSSNFTPTNAALVVSGQVTVDDLRPLVEKAFGSWQGVGTDPGVSVPPEPTDARLILVDRPGATQTTVRVGSLGMPRSSPDYDGAQVLDAALGGLYSSRINLNLRQEHGYTYGAFSQFVYRRSPGYFQVGSAVRTDATAPAVREIFNELRRIRDAPLSGDELDKAKEYLIRSLPTQYETSADVASVDAELYTYDLPLDYYGGEGQRLSRITADQVQAVASRHIHPDEMIVVAVGDLQAIRAPLEALRLGPVQLRDTDGEPIP